MEYYKKLFLGVIIVVLIILILLGIVMNNANKNQMYPPVYPTCPDYYSTNSDFNCVANTSVWGNIPTITGVTGFNVKNPSCSLLDLSSNTIFNAAGSGPKSGLCAKKTWANQCGVSWDGISNNNSICYS